MYQVIETNIRMVQTGIIILPKLNEKIKAENQSRSQQSSVKFDDVGVLKSVDIESVMGKQLVWIFFELL